jgi:hypothetical protein
MPNRSALLTVALPGAKPTLADAAAKLGVKAADLDAGFGLVPIDPAQGLYTVELDADLAERVAGKSGGEAEVYSNPEIAAFGMSGQSGGEPGEDPV